MHFERILCPIDFSDFSVSAFEYALTIADYYKAHCAPWSRGNIRMPITPAQAVTLRISQRPCVKVAVRT
jgi:hypothetical protein